MELLDNPRKLYAKYWTGLRRNLVQSSSLGEIHSVDAKELHSHQRLTRRWHGFWDLAGEEQRRDWTFASLNI